MTPCHRRTCFSLSPRPMAPEPVVMDPSMRNQESHSESLMIFYAHFPTRFRLSCKGFCRPAMGAGAAVAGVGRPNGSLWPPLAVSWKGTDHDRLFKHNPWWFPITDYGLGPGIPDQRKRSPLNPFACENQGSRASRVSTATLYRLAKRSSKPRADSMLMAG